MCVNRHYIIGLPFIFKTIVRQTDSTLFILCNIKIMFLEKSSVISDAVLFYFFRYGCFILKTGCFAVLLVLLNNISLYT